MRCARRATRASSPSQPTTTRHGPGASCPDAAAFRAVSASSDRRQTSAASPACSIARKASHPACQESITQPSFSFAAGTGRTASVACVITPSAPSEPTTSPRRSGPAALAGSGGRSSVPVGAASRTPVTSSSMRP